MEADFINRFPWEDALLQEALDEEEWPEEAKVSYRPLQDQFKFWTAYIVRDHLFPDGTFRDFWDPSNSFSSPKELRDLKLKYASLFGNT